MTPSLEGVEKAATLALDIRGSVTGYDCRMAEKASAVEP